MSGIAIIGLACRFPDADSPEELWELVLAQRRAFRPIPPERLRREDYAGEGADSTYLTHAALIDGFRFDRARFRIAQGVFRAADPAHWLALETAAAALADAGFPDAKGLPRREVGVVVGNSLTGEVSRAEGLRLRWPYVRRVIDAELAAEGRDSEDREALLARLEARYKAPFAAPSEESLAGGLANTIAGRICNHFDLGAGGFTVDGACASSLLAVAQGCGALATGDAEVVLAGGVDISLDPFELVGFARTGALAREAMRVYDASPTGFWPGEGCGFVVLMREEDARTRGRRVHATIRGWGVSSDGQGGLTRPSPEGQRRALDRAYRRAGFDIASVPWFEGHGTGTEVGDRVEIRAIADARRESDPDPPPAHLGSIKANIGHTKAAAGIAGLLKAVLAVRSAVIPPSTGFRAPHPDLAGAGLGLLREGMPWPVDRPLRAGVSGSGFGGINVHVVIEGDAARPPFDERTQSILRSAQDAELLLIAAEETAKLRARAGELARIAPRLSFAELGDLAVSLARELAVSPAPGGRIARAAIVASSGEELAGALTELGERLDRGERSTIGATLSFGIGELPHRVGFLFPGQGSPAHADGGAMRRRYPGVAALYPEGAAEEDEGSGRTAAAQPAIIRASLAALLLLERAGISAEVACGHSLGELAALAWGGALPRDEALAIAQLRGEAMQVCGGQDPGAMAALAATRERVEQILAGLDVVLAGDNAPRSAVWSGPSADIDRLIERARAAGIAATRLLVSHAFHSRIVAPAAEGLRRALSARSFRPLSSPVISTVTGDILDPGEDIAELLVRQVGAPVRFREAIARMATRADLLIEVGPGRALSSLAAMQEGRPTLPTDAGGESLRPLLEAVGAAFALGAARTPQAILVDRFARPFSPDHTHRFIENPCESAVPSADSSGTSDPRPAPSPPVRGRAPKDGDILEQVKLVLAESTQLPAIDDEARLLEDLHLSSISVGIIVARVCERLGLPAPVAPNEFAGGTVREVARAIEAMRAAGGRDEGDFVAGVERWVRAFRIVERPLVAPAGRAPSVSAPAEWRIVADGTDGNPDPDVEALRRALVEGRLGSGVLVVSDRPGQTALALRAAREAVEPPPSGSPRRLLLVERASGRGIAPFFRTLALERRDIAVTIARATTLSSAAIARIVRETADGRSELRVAADGSATVERLVPLPVPPAAGAVPLGLDDRILVTGGGKGIAAECALALARRSGAALVLLGRSDPTRDPLLRENLRRFSGVRSRYVSADVTDRGSVAAAIASVAGEGSITAVIHGAGRNEPRAIRDLDLGTIERTIAPKVAGLENVLAALDEGRLRLLVAFASVIGRVGLGGEADYALANAWLAESVEEFGREHPRCRALALEWSVWSGVGMGERLGRIEALRSAGIDAITPEQGVYVLEKLLAGPPGDVTVVVSGRLGAPGAFEAVETPLLRFLERPRVSTAGVELVADAELSPASDPYLDDHILSGERILPAVIGLEAMAQGASPFLGERIDFSDVRFASPIATLGPFRLRTAVLVRGGDEVEVVLRSSSTNFSIDHFRARCRRASPVPGDALPRIALPRRAFPLDAAALYGDILFQRGRFRRLASYLHLDARSCRAEIRPAEASEPWFRGFHAPRLLLGDPGARDAALHAIQACVPQATILPVSVSRIEIHRTGIAAEVAAVERVRRGGTFIYDLEVVDAAGDLLERWTGLELVIVEGPTRVGSWSEALVGPYLERQVGDLTGTDAFRAVLERNGAGGDDTAWAGVSSTPVLRRPDGKPTTPHWHCSAAHAGSLVLRVGAPLPVSCDLETRTERPADDWRGLLGRDRFDLAGVISAHAADDLDGAATRVWGAIECLKKIGAPAASPIRLRDARGDWVHLHSGGYEIATWSARIRDERLVFALLVGGGRRE